MDKAKMYVQAKRPEMEAEMHVLSRPIIKNGSILSIGGNIAATKVKVDQHFNWFQKKMWKLLLGITIEDYREE